MTLFDELGHAGPNCYWILVAICVEKLDKEQGRKFTEADCEFHFHERLIREKFRLSRPKIQAWLDLAQTLDLLSFEISKSEIKIVMPKLLESLDRDAKRARHKRGETATDARLEGDKEEEREKDKEIEVEEQPAATQKNSVPEIRTTGQKFGPLPEFASDPILAPALSGITHDVQKGWVERWELEPLRQILRNAVQHHTAKENVPASAISNWGLRLNTWIRREKKPGLMPARGQGHDPFESNDGWKLFEQYLRLNHNQGTGGIKMQPAFFREQMRRVRSEFGPENYDREKLILIWQSTCDLPEKNFQELVDHLIGNNKREYPPNLEAFKAAANLQRKQIRIAEEQKALAESKPLVGGELSPEVKEVLKEKYGTTSPSEAFQAIVKQNSLHAAIFKEKAGDK